MSQVLQDVNWDALFKELYPGNLPAELMQRKHPFLSMVPKSGEAYGEYIVVPVLIDGPSGRSAKIEDLLASNGPIGPSKSRKFNVSLVEDYAGHWLNELTLRKTANDRGAFVAARKHEVDGLLRALGNSLSHALFREGSGAIARGDGAWSVTGNVITLLTKSDTKFFVLGMPLDFIPNSGGAPSGAARTVASGNRAVVTKIDEDAGTVTCAEDVTGAAVANLSTVYSSLANTDWIAPMGDYNSAYGTTGAEKVKGLAAWIPLASPSGGESFWGVDRSAYPTRLAGHRLNDPNAPAEDSIMSLAEVMTERGAEFDTCIVSPRQFSKIAKRMNAKVEYQGAGGTADYGFARIVIHTSGGSLPIFADSDCPEDRGYILNMKSWKLRHLGGLPEIVTTDGLSALRRPGLDQIEIRARYYAQLTCDRPGDNGVFAVS